MWVHTTFHGIVKTQIRTKSNALWTIRDDLKTD